MNPLLKAEEADALVSYRHAAYSVAERALGSSKGSLRQPKIELSLRAGFERHWHQNLILASSLCWVVVPESYLGDLLERTWEQLKAL